MEKVNEIKETIMETMNTFKSGVSFVDFENSLDAKGIPYKGSFALCVPGNDNILLWGGMSEDYSKAVEELMFHDLKILPVGSIPLVYFADGKALKYPVAKNLKHKYKTERWAPTVFQLGSLKNS